MYKNMRVITVSGEHISGEFIDTIEKALVIDYKYGWFPYHSKSDIIYKERILLRLDNDCSFEEEIEYLKEQIAKIDEK